MSSGERPRRLVRRSTRLGPDRAGLQVVAIYRGGPFESFLANGLPAPGTQGSQQHRAAFLNPTPAFLHCTISRTSRFYRKYNDSRHPSVARRYPMLLALLEEGAMTLTTITLVAPHLTDENQARVLESTRHKSRRDVERIVAELRPVSDVAPTIRKLPRAQVAGATMPHSLAAVVPMAATEHRLLASTPAVHRPVIAPLAPERYRVQVTVSGETHDKLRRVQDLLRHAVPNGDPAEIIDRALSLLLDRLERDKCASTSKPQPSRNTEQVANSRHIPAAIRREVWTRDQGRCAFVGSRGRCNERGCLEFHHVVPFAIGGAAHAQNLELRCRAHNAFEAQVFFGGEVVTAPVQRGKRSTKSTKQDPLGGRRAATLAFRQNRLGPVPGRPRRVSGIRLRRAATRTLYRFCDDDDICARHRTDLRRRSFHHDRRRPKLAPRTRRMCVPRIFPRRSEAHGGDAIPPEALSWRARQLT